MLRMQEAVADEPVLLVNMISDVDALQFSHAVVEQKLTQFKLDVRSVHDQIQVGHRRFNEKARHL